MSKIIVLILIVFSCCIIVSIKRARFYSAIRCKECKKIYWNSPCTLPHYCKKCGAHIVDLERTGDGIFEPYSYFSEIVKENAEKIVAKKIFFWWKIRKEESDGMEQRI